LGQRVEIWSRISGHKSFQLADLIHQKLFEMDRPSIRDVWATNLEDEINRMAELVDTHPYIALDTEFPGTLVR